MGEILLNGVVEFKMSRSSSFLGYGCS